MKSADLWAEVPSDLQALVRMSVLEPDELPFEVAIPEELEALANTPRGDDFDDAAAQRLRDWLHQRELLAEHQAQLLERLDALDDGDWRYYEWAVQLRSPWALTGYLAATEAEQYLTNQPSPT